MSSERAVLGRWWPGVVLVAAAGAALAAVLLVHAPRAPLSNRVDSVARSLRCPTCSGESVAASDTPIARGMRAQIRAQLRRGRSPAEVRAWFVGRYGPDILTTPSTRGPELALWVLPVVVLGVGALVVLARLRSGRARSAARPGGTGGRALSGRRVALAAAVCVSAGIAVPVGAALPSLGSGAADAGQAAGSDHIGTTGWLRLGRSLDRQGDPTGAEQAYRSALDAQPGNSAARTRLAFDLLREHHLAAAEALVRPAAEHRSSHRALALLVLGLAQRGRDERTAVTTLREFLRVAPHHPAASQVRRLLRRDHTVDERVP